ncbi:MAG: hypothetical protein JXL81_06940 [Deltaproteobacteria bacterium]|nr:hypothetical protein [Deltaproteobacteria bacterium]
MNRLKLITGVILVFFAGLLTGAVITGFYYKVRINDFAAGGPPEGERIRMLLNRFSHDLGLSDTQKTEIEKVLRDIQDEIFQLSRKTFPAIEELNEKGLEQIKAILNSEQREKFNNFQNRLKRVHDRFAVRLDFPGKPPAPDINEMKDQLGLTPEQLSEIKKIMDEGFQKREQIMKENREEDHPDFSRIRREMMETEKAQRDRIEKILTPDQMKAYKKYREERRPQGRPGPGYNPSGDPPGPGPDPSGNPPLPPGW